MSGISKKLMGTTAAGGGFTAIEDVFSTYLYAGNGSTQTITNGIDLAGEGGLVWFKDRTLAVNNRVFDTERGYQFSLITNGTGAQSNHGSTGLTGFNSDGFGLGSAVANASGSNYASWTFRKAPRFFDVVTYTGDGTSSRSISHSLGSAPGVIIVKRTDFAANWMVWHRNLGSSEFMNLNTTGAAVANSVGFGTNGNTDATFGVGAFLNGSGETYVAYLFAHNDGDGGFGPDGDADIIKCGSFTSDGSGLATVDVGFEPQWVLYKGSTAATNWSIADSMRGFVADTASASGKYLNANSDSAELSYAPVGLTNTGFKYNSAPNIGFIYIAIRRGPMRAPESGTEVFGGLTHTGTGVGRSLTDLGFSPDLLLSRPRSGVAVGYGVYDRLRGFLGSNQILQTYNTGAEFSDATGLNASITKIEQGVISLGQDSFYGHTNFNTRPYITHAFRRAPNFFDCVAYAGDGNSSQTVNHNLGVAPEMMWVKRRNSTGEWPVYHKDLSVGNRGLVLQHVSGTYASEYWNNSNPTSTTFPVGEGSNLNASGSTYIAYLFASLDGVSKVGSYTGNGSSQTIDCGFTTGARFILIKRTDSTGDWYVWDTARGIVTGNDPHLSLNTTVAEVTTDDSIDPDSSGFIVNQVGDTNINVSSASYIFYAIA